MKILNTNQLRLVSVQDICKRANDMRDVSGVLIWFCGVTRKYWLLERTVNISTLIKL
jgi:hypothetical protein